MTLLTMAIPDGVAGQHAEEAGQQQCAVGRRGQGG